MSNNFAAIGFAILVGAVIVGILLLMGLVGRWIVGPMDRAVRDVQAPSQFFMVDLFGLAVQLQIVTLVPASILQADDGLWNTAMVAGAFLWIATTVIWWASIRALSRAGVGAPLKRVVFSTIVLPFTLACIIAASLGNTVLFFRLADSTPPRLWWMIVVPLLGLNVGIALAAYGGRLLTHWILAHPTLGRESTPP